MLLRAIRTILGLRRGLSLSECEAMLAADPVACNRFYERIHQWKHAHSAEEPCDTDLLGKDAERDSVIAALRRSSGNQRLAAKLLGITEPTLYRRMQKFDIQESEYLEFRAMATVGGR